MFQSRIAHFKDKVRPFQQMPEVESYRQQQQQQHHHHHPHHHSRPSSSSGLSTAPQDSLGSHPSTSASTHGVTRETSAITAKEAIYIQPIGPVMANPMITPAIHAIINDVVTTAVAQYAGLCPSWTVWPTVARIAGTQETSDIFNPDLNGDYSTGLSYDLRYRPKKLVRVLAFATGTTLQQT